MKKRFPLLTLALCLCLLLCPLNAFGEAAPEMAAVQELVIGENQDYTGYDPMTGVNPFTVRGLIFETLTIIDYDYTKVGGLAEDWSMSDDGTVWTFHLRKGVTFHDGEPWNAAAAKFNWEQRLASGASGYFKMIDHMETPDEYTFVVYLNKPSYTFASEIAMPTQGFLSPKAFNENHEVVASIGTGPFKLDSWTPDVDFVLTANENYYNGAPLLDKITFKVIPDSNARALALESGEIDMMSGRSALTALETLKNQENIQVIKTMSQTSAFVIMNTHDEILSNLNIRRALAAATNFAQDVPALLSDLAEPAVNLFSPVFGKFLDQSIQLPAYDPDLSRELLAQEGYTDTDGDGFVDKDGQKLTFTITVASNDEEQKALCTVMQQELKQVGIDLVISAVDASTLTSTTTEGNFQLSMQGQNYVPNDDPTMNYYSGYFHKNSYNHIFYNDELDAMVDRLYTSLDEEERLSLHHQIQNYVVDHVPVIMVFHRNNIILCDKKVQGFEIASGTWQLYKGLEKAYIAA